MESMLFGASCKLFTITDLESFLDAISKPYKPTSNRKVLVSSLLDFEELIGSSCQASLAVDIRFYFDSKNSPAAPRAKRCLLRALRRVSLEQERRRQSEKSQEEAEMDKESRENVSKTNLRKRKHSEISKGTRKLKNGKPSVPKLRECSTCCESLPQENFPNANITASCKHSNSVCTFCIRAYVDAKVDMGGFAFIACPICPEELALDDVRRLCVSEIFEKYGRLLSRSTLPIDPVFHFCLGPGCGSGQYNDDKKSRKMTCQVCQFATCTQHGIAWHTGQTCEEFDTETHKTLARAEQRDTLQEHKETREVKKKGQQGLVARVRGRETITSQPVTEGMRQKPNRKEGATEAVEIGRVEKARRAEQIKRESTTKEAALADAEALKLKSAEKKKAPLPSVSRTRMNRPKERRRSLERRSRRH